MKNHYVGNSFDKITFTSPHLVQLSFQKSILKMLSLNPMRKFISFHTHNNKHMITFLTFGTHVQFLSLDKFKVVNVTDDSGSKVSTSPFFVICLLLSVFCWELKFFRQQKTTLCTWMCMDNQKTQALFLGIMLSS